MYLQDSISKPYQRAVLVGKESVTGGGGLFARRRGQLRVRLEDYSIDGLHGLGHALHFLGRQVGAGCASQ